MKKPESTPRLQKLSGGALYDAWPLVTIMQQVEIMPGEAVAFWQQGQGNGIFPDLGDSQAASLQVIEWVYS